jgi:hypothetical protein
MEKTRKLLATLAPEINDRAEDQAAILAVLDAEIAAASGDDPAAQRFLKPPRVV